MHKIDFAFILAFELFSNNPNESAVFNDSMTIYMYKLIKWNFIEL